MGELIFFDSNDERKERLDFIRNENIKILEDVLLRLKNGEDLTLLVSTVDNGLLTDAYISDDVPFERVLAMIEIIKGIYV